MKWRGTFLAAAIVGTLFIQIPNRAVAQTPATEKKASPFEQAVTGMKKVDGLWTVYHKDQRLLVDFSSSHLNRDFIIITSIARGISKRPILGGMSWGFGDDVLWTFRKVGDKLHVVRRNIRFRANPGSPEGNAVEMAYTDSVLYALPIMTTTPTGGMLVDMSRIFMSDDEQIGRFIGPGFSFAYDRSTWEKVKSFPKNVELEVAAIYSGHGGRSDDEMDTVMDPRGVQVNVHYSISLLPTSGYRPRVADDRVGYFLTAIKDFSDKSDDQHFLRYVNRWNLQKADPSAKLSPPREPIIFYLEKTVPIALRPIVRSGIEEWNKAFEKLGYANAIEVRQQRDDDDWDPEDVRYNTFRWITANAGFAMGPSRVNPLTGQILDADIIFDADFMTHWKQQYETFTLKDSAPFTGQSQDPDKVPVGQLFGQTPQLTHPHCAHSQGMAQQLGFAASIFTARDEVSAGGRQLPEEFIRQGLKEVVMHEVGHTLGLRHNFKASAWKTLAEIDDPVKGAAEGTVASVMDYTPANIAPKGTKQGLYFTPTIGPYDYWAIEYGYKSMPGDEVTELQKLASRAAEPALDYGTDEDTRDYIDSDPLTNRFDLGKDPLEYSLRQMKLALELLPLVVEKAVAKGEGYQRARLAFNYLFHEFWRTTVYTARVPGGIYVARDHKGDPNGRAPFRLVDPVQQRKAMDQLATTAFNPPPLPIEVLNYLATTHWNHWGVKEPMRMDYPAHENVVLMQTQVLRQLLSPYTLKRLHDNEVKLADDKDSYTLAEHFRKLLQGTFTEVREKPKAGNYSERKPFVTTYRRNLQRVTLKAFAALVTNSNVAAPPSIFSMPIVTVPEDARTLARMYLSDLDKQIGAVLTAPGVTLDDYSRAHLLDTQERIRKALGAQVVTPSIN